jgi:hypothetical protein
MSQLERLQESSRKAPKKSDVKPKTKAAWKYVNLSPTKDEKALIVDKYSDPRDLVQMLTIIADNEYRVGIKYRETDGAFQVSVYAPEKDHVNAGMSLCAYAGDVERALSIIFWGVTDKFGLLTKWPTGQLNFDTEW